METAGAADPGAVQDPAGVEPWRRVAARAGLMGIWELDVVRGDVVELLVSELAANGVRHARASAWGTATTPSGGTATWFRVDGR